MSSDSLSLPPRQSRVSVVISTFNRADYICEALDSLLLQTRPPDEIVVVDDASTDGTREILRRYESVIRVVRLASNQGKAVALNTLLPEIEGDLVWFFDDDDVALPDALERHLAVLDHDPGVDFTYSDAYHCDRTNIWDRRQWRVNRAPDVSAEAFMLETLFDMQTLMQGMVIRRRCVEAIGMFDPAFDRCQDLDLVIRLAARFTPARLEGPTFVYREHASARGTAASRHAGGARLRVSNSFRKRVFRKTRGTLALPLYLKHIDDADVGESEAALEAAALAQRGCLLLHQGLVSEALQDLEEALSHPGIAEVNRGWLASVLSSAMDVEPWIFDSRRRLVMRLAALLARHDELRTAGHLARGMYWSLRREIDQHHAGQSAQAGFMMVLFTATCGAYKVRHQLGMTRAAAR